MSPIAPQTDDSLVALPSKERRQLRGDLDNIVLKALRKEPDRRYASPEQLAEDIRRHLEGLPVLAVPDSNSYRFGKFVKRHRVGVSAAVLIALVILGGVIATMREARIAAAHQRRAEKHFNDVRKLANSLMFEVHDSIETLPGSTPARKMIVQKSQEYLDSLAQETGNDASLQRELASAYEKVGEVQGSPQNSNLGDTAGALASFQKALAIRQNLDPKQLITDDRLSLVRIYMAIAMIQGVPQGDVASAKKMLLEGDAIAQQVLEKDPGNLRAMDERARICNFIGDLESGNGAGSSFGEVRSGLENHQKALALFMDVSKAQPSNDNLKRTINSIEQSVAEDFSKIGDRQQALQRYFQACDSLKALIGNQQNNLLQRNLALCRSRIGDMYLIEGYPTQALTYYQQEWDLLKPLAAADKKDVDIQTLFVSATANLGHASVAMGKIREGKNLIAQAVSEIQKIAKTVNDAELQSFLALTSIWLGESQEAAGEYPAAQHTYTQALQIYLKLSQDSPQDLENATNVVLTRNHLASVDLQRSSGGIAGVQYKDALVAIEKLKADQSDELALMYAAADVYYGLGTVAEQKHHWDEAQTWYKRSLAMWQKIPHPANITTSGFRVHGFAEASKGLARCHTKSREEI